MKPGWQTSEFWIAIIGQVLALLALTGTINTGDRAKLETALTDAVTAIFTLAASTLVVIRYIRSRSELKTIALATEERPIANGPPRALPLLLLAVFFAAGPALAAEPASAKTCLIIGRQQQPQPQTDPALVAALQQIAQNQQTIIQLLQQRQAAPAPQVIVLPGPQIPLGGAPRQDIPLGGPPKQDLPLGGPPKQEVPLGPPPRQEIPLGPAPRYDIPLKPAPVQPQRFSPALWR